MMDYGVMMNVKRNSLVLLLLTGLVLAGCTSTSTPVTPSPSTVMPTFSAAGPSSGTSSTGEASATDAPVATKTTLPEGLTADEAKAAQGGLAAYKAFFDLTESNTQAGGKDALTQFQKLAMFEALTESVRIANIFVKNGWHGVGTAKIMSVKVDSVSLKQDPKTHTVPVVKMTSCEDAAGAYAVDSTGKRVTPADNPTKYSVQMTASYYPERGGVKGWFITDWSNEGVKSC